MAAPRTPGGLAVPKVPVALVYAAGFIPAAWTFWLAFSDRLGADPVRALEHGIGLWALRFLIATLCVTPLRRHVNLLRYRRALGLMAFWYALLHLGVWLLFDRGLDPQAVLADIVKRPYITIGMAALAILLPLAATSNAWSIRRLGGAGWARLHKLVYAAAALAALHFVMVLKVWQIEPLVYAAIIAGLLGYRLVKAVRKPARPRTVRA